jgi:hypothetical protein
VGVQPVVAHADSQAGGKPEQEQCDCQIDPTEREQCSNGPDVQEDERQSNRPVQSSFGGKPNGFRREFFTG